ncbi:MAG TPA: transposase [Chryseosolibacter sp.]|nr:transposase [Chryseosolibacter sp.]
MANLKDYEKLTVKERINRYFSEDFKRKKVSEIDRNLSSVSEVCRVYQVSHTAVYKWIYQYSVMRKKGIKQVVEAKSDSRKIEALKEQIKELERIIGEKQVKLDFQEKMIEIAEKQYQIDIKKKFSGKRSSGTGSKGTSTK